MNRGFVRTLLCAGVLATALMTANQANAGWHHWGSYCAGPYVGWTGYSYSYYGGFGCCAPTYCAPAYCAPAPCYEPCYTPCFYRGCGLLSRWAYRCRSHHYNYYWGCGSPCYTSCCSSCGCADCGCGGGIIDYGIPADAMPADAVPAEPSPADPSMLPEKQTSLDRESALLTVNVPDNARVLVNGIATQSKGDLRRYVSRNLVPGFDYTYEVKAEVMIDGTPVTQTKTVQLRAGTQAKLAFDMQAAERLETALTVHVPANAKVYLAGNQTKGTGAVRTFRTTKLPNGQSWSDYVVRVVLSENGLDRSKEEKITLRAGEERELSFDFDIDKVASR